MEALIKASASLACRRCFHKGHSTSYAQCCIVLRPRCASWTYKTMCEAACQILLIVACPRALRYLSVCESQCVLCQKVA